MPTLPEGSPVPAEDALAFFRDDLAFRSVRFVERPNGDFGETIARLLVFSTHRLSILAKLRGSKDRVLAAIATKGVKELTYHRDYAARWFVTLAQGTDESRRRLVHGLDQVFPFYDELVATHPVERESASQGFGVDPAEVAAEVDVVLDQVFAVAGVERPVVKSVGAVAGGRGRDGRHTESFSKMLAEMQVVARAHPLGLW